MAYIGASPLGSPVANTVVQGSIATGAVTTTAIAANAITTGLIADGAVGSNDIASDAIITAKIASGAVTTAKLDTSIGITGTLTTGNINSLRGYIEKATVITGGLDSSNTYSLFDGPVHYHTGNSAANATVNLTGFSTLSTGNTASMAILVTNNNLPRYVQTVQVDGTTSGVTTKWLGGSAPSSGNSSNIDVYSFSVIKTGASAYTVLASQSQFG